MVGDECHFLGWNDTTFRFSDVHFTGSAASLGKRDVA